MARQTTADELRELNEQSETDAEEAAEDAENNGVTPSTDGSTPVEDEGTDRGERFHIFIQVPEAMKEAVLAKAKEADMPYSAWARQALADAAGFYLEHNTGTGLPEAPRAATSGLTKEERKEASKNRKTLVDRLMAALASGEIKAEDLGIKQETIEAARITKS